MKTLVNNNMEKWQVSNKIIKLIKKKPKILNDKNMKLASVINR